MIASLARLTNLTMLSDAVLFRAQIQQQGEIDHSKQVNIHLYISISSPNEFQSISVSLVHLYLVKHFLDISHDAEFTLMKPEWNSN